VVAGALILAAAAAVAVVRTQHRSDQTHATSPSESPLIIPTGEPADWTDISTVIAEVPDRIHCTRLLPDQRTIRFVWGTPPRAEDIDTTTRKRISSPLIPASYAEGCPDLSADGKRLVYQGHAADGRAFAFLSEYSDGREAVPVVPTAEPSMSSEPTWLADGQTFSFDVDPKHTGVFSTATGRMRVLPETTAKPFVTSFRYVSGNRVYVATVLESGEAEFLEIGMPEMKLGTRFRLPPVALDLCTAGSVFYLSYGGPEKAEMVELDVSKGEARSIGWLRGQLWLRYPVVLPAGLAFVGAQLSTTVAVAGPDGTTHKWQTTGIVMSAARCGDDIVVASARDGRVKIDRLGPDGRFIATVTDGPWDTDAACSSDGRTLFYLRQKTRPGVVRCDETGCRDLVDRVGVDLAASPDGKRLAFITADDKRGAIVEIVNADTGESRKLIETETGCRPGWTSNEALWVSRRQGTKIVWTEVNADSAAETGRVMPGSRDCTDGKPDPVSPAESDVRVIFERTSQLRLLGREHLSRH
jgi:hypothetical protein